MALRKRKAAVAASAAAAAGGEKIEKQRTLRQQIRDTSRLLSRVIAKKRKEGVAIFCCKVG